MSRLYHKSYQWCEVANVFKYMKLRLIPQAWWRMYRLQRHKGRVLKRLSPLFFLVSFVTVLLLNSLTPAIAQEAAPSESIPQPPRQEIRGVWMTNNDFDTLKNRAKVQDAMNQLRRLNFNTIYPVVWNSGYVMYPSAIAKGAGIQPFVLRGSDGHDILADLIAQAHRQNLLAIPWFEFGFMAPPTSELALNHPDWLTQKRDGSETSISAAGEVAWLNPFHPKVQQFITDLVLEIVTQYDVDGIQFDDHMSLPYEFGYDKYTVALYSQETKNNPPANAQDAAWMRWRADKITAFMVQLNQAVKARKPNVIFSVSPNYYDFAYKFQLQDWLSWVQQNIVDELIVQVYRPNLASFTTTISRPEIQQVQQIIPTGIGIMAGSQKGSVSMQQISSQVRAAQERGLGVAFFYYQSLWNSAPEPAKHRQATFQTLFLTPALRARARIELPLNTTSAQEP
ncbi:glycoside hydrolase family 10 protein [Brasilonema octagenarum UFV-OR1]|uniref:Glycoside hydrolase family 10 protein n=2 Tax=Octagenarum group TaxID=3398494 RepID=A0ABX1M9E7_9CYAN|nr:glycoside hydrolase family 10 protein [Brasilonema octagenarum UFV-OR1]